MSKYKRTSLKYHWESLILCNEDRTGERGKMSIHESVRRKSLFRRTNVNRPHFSFEQSMTIAS